MLFATVVATLIPVVALFIDGVVESIVVPAVIPVVEESIFVHDLDPAESHAAKLGLF